MFNHPTPRRRDRAFVTSSHESTELKRFASVWTDGASVGVVAFDKTARWLKPVSEWQSSASGLSHLNDLIDTLRAWHGATPLERAIVNIQSGIEPEQHPVRRLLTGCLQCDVVAPTSPAEGLARYQETSETGRLDLAGYSGGARLIERIRRLPGPPEPLLMAFLQGIAREPKFYSYTTERVHVGTPERYRSLYDYMP